MSYAEWPAGLPQGPLMGLTRETQPNVIGFVTSNGPAKIRRASSIPVEYQTTEIELLGSELAIFDTFFDTTLVSGTLPFTWEDMVTGESATFRFNGIKPSFELIGGADDEDIRRYYGVLRLEKLQ